MLQVGDEVIIKGHKGKVFNHSYYFVQFHDHGDTCIELDCDGAKAVFEKRGYKMYHGSSFGGFYKLSELEEYVNYLNGESQVTQPLFGAML